MTDLPRQDLFALTAALVDIASESFCEARIADAIEADLRGCGHLEVHRVADNVIARTVAGRSRRLLLGGHTDTVPAAGNDRAVIRGDRIEGVGATDMKGGVAVMLELARELTEPAIDVTYVFYACEEVAQRHSGLLQIEAARPELLDGDVALLGEPTLGALEAGCQGNLTMQATLHGERAHSARPWMGRNAVHRLAGLLSLIAGYEPRMPVVEGCEYAEALQAVAVTGGIAHNVVPDSATLRINHRFAPDRTLESAEAFLRDFLAPAFEDDDTLEVLHGSPAARPGLDDPLLRTLVERNSLEVRAKLGWTDVAFFFERGVPASNFGPGDPALAHTAGEYVERQWLLDAHGALQDLLAIGI